MNMSLPIRKNSEQLKIFAKIKKNISKASSKGLNPIFIQKKEDYFYEAIIVMFKNNINLKISFRPVY